MSGFSDLLSDKDIHNLTKYIISKRQGWDHVDYRIYPVEAGATPDFSFLEKTEPVVTGRFKNGLADFERIEIPNYAVVLEGPFNAPWPAEAVLLFEEAGWTNANKNTRLRLEIDGNFIEPMDRGAWDWVFPIKKGAQNLKVAYFVSDPSAPGEDWTIWHKSSARVFVMRTDGSAKLTPLSRRAKIQMEDSTMVVEVNDLPSVVRIRTLDLPAYSINVGLPNDVSYAFNTRSCNIVGLWDGEFLDIGPNVIGRGKQASEAIGNWAFRYPEVLSLDEPNTELCEFEKYTRGEAPAFYFKRGERRYRLKGWTSDAGIRFEVSVLGASASDRIHIGFPELQTYTAKNVDALGSNFSNQMDNGYRPLQYIVIEKN